MKYLNVCGGSQALVDDDLYDRLNEFSWCLGNRGYPQTRLKCEHGRTMRMLHQVVICLFYNIDCLCDTTYAEHGFNIDHINHDRLDARIENLRYLSAERNKQRQQKQTKHSSQYRGVSWDKATGKWMARIQIDGKPLYLGLFDTEDAASAAYNNYITLHGLDRELNM